MSARRDFLLFYFENKFVPDFASNFATAIFNKRINSCSEIDPHSRTKQN